MRWMLLVCAMLFVAACGDVALPGDGTELSGVTDNACQAGQVSHFRHCCSPTDEACPNMNGAVGAACSGSQDCSRSRTVCQMVFPGGYCGGECSGSGTLCGYEQNGGEQLGICLPLAVSGVTACLARCERVGVPCARTGYVCAPSLVIGSTEGVCLPNCRMSVWCSSGQTCDASTGLCR